MRAAFTSLPRSVVSLERLHRCGRAEMSDVSWLNRVNRVFRADVGPMCITAFQDAT